MTDTITLNAHRSNFQTIYNSLNGNSESTREMKKLLQNILNIEESIPADFALNQNYPNPFNPKTTIKYQLPEPGEVELTIYNLLGQKVVSLVKENQEAGEYTYEWAASNISSGIYLYNLKVKNSFTKTRKMLLVK